MVEQTARIDKDKTLKTVSDLWDSWYMAGLMDFIRIPNLTPLVDAEYKTNGLLEKAIDLVDDYVNKLEIKGISREIFKIPAAKEGDLPSNPLIVYVIEPTEGQERNIMLYGHLDKQPYEEPWDEGLSPTDPVIKDGRLYGRGGSDDGYAVFSCMLAVKAAQEQGVPMPRVVMVLETEEESGSDDLIALLKAAEPLIQEPDCCFCMDSGCLDYKQLWVTSSLRGCAMVDVQVECAKGGYHSGEVGGIVPETFRVLRVLLDRLDDVETGKVASEFQPELPEWKVNEAKELAQSQGTTLYDKFPLLDGVKYMAEDDLIELYLNGTWRPNLAITGASGLPKIEIAGNVVRAMTSVRCSMRLSPVFDSKKGVELLIEKLTKNVPYNAKVTITGSNNGDGWCQKVPTEWLSQAIEDAGQAFFDLPSGSYGEGGSIPFLKELENKYPKTQIVAFGVGGPYSNAHAPNEMIEIEYAKKLTCSLAHVLADCTTKA